MKFFVEMVGSFAIILTVYSVLYFLLAGTAYWVFYGRKSAALQKLRIQAIYPTKKSIRREIRWSLLTMLVVSILTQLTVIMVQQGWSRMYYRIASHGWIYFVASIVAGILLNDTWFYWTHRFMHLKKVFPYVHRIHHLSKAPTPWAIYSFSPAEAFLNFLIFPLLVFVIPMHPYAIATVILYNLVLNHNRAPWALRLCPSGSATSG